MSWKAKATELWDRVCAVDYDTVWADYFSLLAVVGYRFVLTALIVLFLVALWRVVPYIFAGLIPLAGLWVWRWVVEFKRT